MPAVLLDVRAWVAEQARVKADGRAIVTES
jgi:hypothetical protein